MAVDDVAAPAVGMEDQAALPENSTTTGDQTPWAASYRIAQLERQLEEEEKRRRHADTCLDERTAELERLETAAALAKTQLAQAREHIFGLQSPRADITDTEAAEAFGALYAGIERWVQNRLDPVLGALFDGRLAELRQPDAVAAGPLLALVREPARGWTKAAQSDEPHAMAAIWEFLRANIFARSFYCPLTDFPGVDMAVLFIDEIVENMAGNLHRGGLYWVTPEERPPLLTDTSISGQTWLAAETGAARLWPPSPATPSSSHAASSTWRPCRPSCQPQWASSFPTRRPTS